MFSLFLSRYLITCPAAGILTPSSPPAASNVLAVVEELFAGLEEVQEGWQPQQNIGIERCQQALARRFSSLQMQFFLTKKNAHVTVGYLLGRSTYRHLLFVINNKQLLIHNKQRLPPSFIRFACSSRFLDL
jgi:hypothetical protein